MELPPPQIPVLCPQLNLLNPPHPPNKIPGYATVQHYMNKRKISKSEILNSSFTEQMMVWSVLPEKCGGERLTLNYASFQTARMFEVFL